MGLIAYVNDVPRKALIGGLAVTRTLSDNHRLAVNILCPGGTNRPVKGDQIIVEKDNFRLFGGLIDSCRVVGVGGELSETLITSVRATDFRIYSTWKHVNGVLPAGRLKNHLQIIADLLNPYGVTLDPNQDWGPDLPDFTHFYRRIDEVLAEIARISGWYIEIDYYKVLRGIEPGSDVIPEIDDGDIVGDLVVMEELTDRATKIILMAGSGTKTVAGVTLTGNGVTRTFPLPIPAAERPPQIYDRAAAAYRNMGIYGLDTLFEWTWDAATQSIIQLAEAPPGTPFSPLGAGVIVDVVPYQGNYPFPVVADSGEAPENTIERIVEEPDVFDPTVAVALASAYLSQSLEAPPKLQYTNYMEGLSPGQVQRIRSVRRNVDSWFLLTDVRLVGEEMDRVRYTVTVVESEIAPNTWRDIVRGWSGSGSNTGSGASPGVITIGSGLAGAGVTGELAIWLTPTTLGSTPIGAASAKTWFLGGSGLESVVSIASTWVPASIIQIRLNRNAVPVRIYGRLKTAEAGVTVVAGLYNVSLGTICSGTSTAVTSTSWTNIDFYATLNNGDYIYELRLYTLTGQTHVFGTAHLEE